MDSKFFFFWQYEDSAAQQTFNLFIELNIIVATDPAWVEAED